MIRLEITDPTTNAIHVPHLPATLSFTLLRENPLFNHRGDYTYDIDISLRDPHNRAIFSHINRLTANSRPQNRHARLICDGRIIADGTEVVLKKDDETLKIQILAGNSEINYLTADESLMVRDMDFGTIPEPTTEQAKAVSNKFYPQTNYVFPMLCKGTSTADGYDNEYHRGAWIQGGNENGINYREGTALWPQPYLLYYVEKFIQLLGYEITRNDLRDDVRWTRLLLISGYRSLQYAKMLPNWTAAQFLNEIERFFNCIILTNPLLHTAQIVKIPDFYANVEPTEIKSEDITDKFQCDYDTANSDIIIAHNNLRYNLPSNAYYRYKCLSEDIEVAAKKVEMYYDDALELEDNDWQIYSNGISNPLKYVITKDRDSDGNVIRKRIHFVDEYRHEAPADTNWNEMAIIPAATFVRFYKPASIAYNPPLWVAIVSAWPDYYDNSQAGDFTKVLIEGGGETASDKMQVAFYTGIIKSSKADQYTGELSTSDIYYAMLQTTPHMWTESPFTTDKNGQYLKQQYFQLTPTQLPVYRQLTLELDGQYGRYQTDFNKNMLADFTTQFTIRFRSKAFLDPAKKFLINNRLFVCQQLKYTYSDGRQHPIVEGIFFPYI